MTWYISTRSNLIKEMFKAWAFCIACIAGIVLLMWYIGLGTGWSPWITVPVNLALVFPIVYFVKFMAFMWIWALT